MAEARGCTDYPDLKRVGHLKQKEYSPASIVIVLEI
jgi:hypothetical protein